MGASNLDIIDSGNTLPNSNGASSGNGIVLSDGETIAVQDWVNDSSKSASTRQNRKRVLTLFAQSNGKSTAEEVLEEIRFGKLNIYQSARHFVDFLRDSKMSPNTVFQYRSFIGPLFKSTLGELSFKQSVFDRLVPVAKPYVLVTKKIPKPDNVRYMLELATPQYRAFVGGLAITGMRITEWLTRKMSDLEIRDDGHARVKLQASETKARTKRYSFLTKEVVDWIKQYHLYLPDNGWVFPGELGNHLSDSTAWFQIKRLFSFAGLEDSEDEIYSPHSFRTFADKQMSRAGLDRKYILLIIGHRSQLGSSGSYKDWDEIEERWVELCEPALTFNKSTELLTAQKVEFDALKRQSDELKDVVQSLVQHLPTETLDRLDKHYRKKLLEFGQRKLTDKSTRST